MAAERIDISLNQLLSSLSIALDLAQNRSHEHARRTAYIALRLADKMGLDDSIRSDIYFASLLHDIGMSGALSRYCINDFQENHVLKKLHADNGYELIRKLPFSKFVADSILFHHDHWDGSGVNGLMGDDISLGAHIIHVADSFDILFDRRNSSFESRHVLLDRIKAGAGGQFHPEVVENMKSIAETEKFWMDLQYHNIHMILNRMEPIQTVSMDVSDLEKIAEVFALLIDNKSEFTYMHSQGISDFSKKMAKNMGYDELKWRKIGIAGYLHDLGKLAVPNEILDKPGSLSIQEFFKIKSHPYYTKLILSQVDGFEDIARWAGNHHEKLDGSGYPECMTVHEITEEDQIIAVADIYQALTEHRPYRKALGKQEALQILNKLAQDKKIMKNVFDCLEAVV
ncbi:HD-GYP domain-containing protein (c-di-GMP phosphodiesterase class II) [Anaerosolibacter carboniphilus]|uniref:HD-GYP domain-containing protein (C-di-GMP phosphodiesterase class II) n=1 Tax=Anaerosolibacter carboniphilus TaxID=1417629 RepID=A0A841L294_9FIRM|nr:HD domain-containing phosphohydrolase [Anaerosolibacter carboniphilus]MBB6218738.1 HD-GYP domain-containing protein (c-di-GMP phosphodiesterase class II) [Anaerosolibacter carboniphilus]